MLKKRISDTSRTSRCDDEVDEEQEKIQMLTLGQRTLSEVRNLCLQSNEKFRIAAQLQDEAERIYHEVECQKYSRQLQNSVSGGITQLKGKLNHQKGFRYESSARNHLEAALNKLETAYTIVNDNYNCDSQIESVATREDAKAFQFLWKRYYPLMKHIGAGLLPSFDDSKDGRKANTFVGTTISGRQIQLLNAVIAEIEEELKSKNVPIVRGRRQHLQKSLSFSFRSFRRGIIVE